jgi:hypothetical protein
MRSGGARSKRRTAPGLLLVVLAAVVGGSGCSKPVTNYTGIWKGNCSDYWGVLITPAEDGLYSVTFCGLSSCLDPGQWTPNTRIENDPMYEVVSSSEIRIKRNDRGYFTYTKCSASSFWLFRPDSY